MASEPLSQPDLAQLKHLMHQINYLVKLGQEQQGEPSPEIQAKLESLKAIRKKLNLSLPQVKVEKKPVARLPVPTTAREDSVNAPEIPKRPVLQGRPSAVPRPLSGSTNQTPVAARKPLEEAKAKILAARSSEIQPPKEPAGEIKGFDLVQLDTNKQVDATKRKAEALLKGASPQQLKRSTLRNQESPQQQSPQTTPAFDILQFDFSATPKKSDSP